MLTNRRSTLIIPSGNNRPAGQQPGAAANLSSAKPDSEPRSTAPAILTSTTPTLPGYRVTRVLGAVYGSTAYALRDTKALLKAAAAGAEVRALTHMMYNARDQALERMARDCVARGANAVVAVMFEEKEVLGFVQVSVCGTALYVEREREREDEKEREKGENPFVSE
ncbi:putative heavy-metal-binding-domain-containing protein [Hypoxylon sp. NC1633]|nr:putative heavy-metal-binding-domain-containing protein [Hypoxylon sp. NC1633]